MRQLAILSAVAACIGIMSTSASAQDVDIYVGPPYAYGPYYGQESAYYFPGYGYGYYAGSEYGYRNHGLRGDGRFSHYRYWARRAFQNGLSQ